MSNIEYPSNFTLLLHCISVVVNCIDKKLTLARPTLNADKPSAALDP